MATDSSERSAFFPAIERKHGQPMSYWFDVMAELAGQSYQQQMAFLQENHGFSRAHANALVLHTRGSTTARRFTSLADYLAPHDAIKQQTVRAIFDTIQLAHPDTEIVIAWNHPLLKYKDQYVLGVSVHTAHLLIGPWDASVLERMRDRLRGLTVNKKTIRVPVDWQVDVRLVRDIAADRIAHIDAGRG